MKQPILRRAAALLLALLLIPGQALAAETAPQDPSAPPESGGSSKPDTPTVTEKWEDILPIQVSSLMLSQEGHVMELTDQPWDRLNASVMFSLKGKSPDPEVRKPVDILWTSSDTGVAAVSAKSDAPGTAVVTPLRPGTTDITATIRDTVDGKVKDFTDSCKVTISGITLASTSLSLLSNQAHSLAYSLYGSAEGQPVTWSSTNISVAEVDNGRIDTHFPGEATITATVGSYHATCSVTVREDIADVVNGSLDAGRLCAFSGLTGQLNSRSVDKTGHSLQKVSTLSVPSSQGTLYYGYRSPEAPGHGVGSSENFYLSPSNGQYSLNDVVFVPAPGFAGTAAISYTGYSTDGQAFRGRIHIEVEQNHDLSYQTTQDHPVHILLEDIQAICRTQTGRSAEYFIFEIPSPRQGDLYRNYTVAGAYAQRVEADMKLTPKTSPTGELATFVPAPGFAGTVTLPYLCMDTYGTSFQGRVIITVRGSSLPSSPELLELSVEQGDYLDLDSEDFNAACRAATGNSLRLLRFDTLPASAAGTLYYKYETKDEMEVSTSTYYTAYYSNYPRLSDITFVPATGFEGVVDLPFTGQDSAGKAFLGTLHITVSVPELRNAKTITYYAEPGEIVSFQTDDFDWACRAATASSLDYVRFTLPARDYGYLYYRDGSDSDRVDSKTRYYRNSSRSKLLSRVSFQTESTPGTVYIKYTGYSSDHRQFRGNVVIYVGAASTAQLSYTGSSVPIPLRTVDFQKVCTEATGSTLRSVSFPRLPSANEGRICLNGLRAELSDVSYAAGTQLDALTFVPRAGFQGHVLLPYEGWTTDGGRFVGTVDIAVSNIYCPTSYPDMERGWEWARPSVEYLRAMGVSNGFEDNTFRPDKTLSRGEYAVMICRAFGFRNSSAPGFSDVPLTSYYASSVAAARERGIILGYEDGTFRPGNSITRQDAALILFRALAITGHDLPYVYDSILNRYTDGSQTGDYAVHALAALVQEEILQGDEQKRLRPQDPISRAEIAVVLHKALTR